MNSDAMRDQAVPYTDDPPEFENDIRRGSEDEEEDVLRDEEDAEQLLHAPRKGLFSRQALDPNQPVLQSAPTRLSTKALKGPRPRPYASEDGNTYLQMESLTDDIDDIASDASSEKYIRRPDPRRVRRKRCLNFLCIPITLLSLLALLILGAYRATQFTRARSIHPAIPQRLRSNGTAQFAPTTIVISLDGFRADFLARNLTPTLLSFVAEGISPKYMTPSFPSVTFPNHWTLVTGLYPESHGVVSNSFYDPELDEQFYYTDTPRSMETKWWGSTGAEPIWSTCEKAGLPAAVHMWPGSEAGVEPTPTFLDTFNGKEKLSRKVRRALQFLDQPSAYDNTTSSKGADIRPQLIAMYVPNIDAQGHRFGPNSTEVNQTLSEVDGMLGQLFTGLNNRNLTSIVNVIVVSDHGMATTSVQRLIQLDNLLDPDQVAYRDGWPLYGLRPKPGVNLTALHDQLVARRHPDAPYQVYLREQLLKQWHYQASPRIAPLWIVPDTGWGIVTKAELDVRQAQRANVVWSPKGLHGYDPAHPLMRAIFVARGPAFPHAPGSAVDPFQNTNLYNILCDSLEIQPAPNNGTLRLPLTTTGRHDKFPPVEGEKEAADDSDLAAGDASDEASTGSKLLNKVKAGWDTVKGKANAALNWLKKVFTSGS